MTLLGVKVYSESLHVGDRTPVCRLGPNLEWFDVTGGSLSEYKGSTRDGEWCLNVRGTMVYPFGGRSRPLQTHYLGESDCLGVLPRPPSGSIRTSHPTPVHRVIPLARLHPRTRGSEVDMVTPRTLRGTRTDQRSLLTVVDRLTRTLTTSQVVNPSFVIKITQTNRFRAETLDENAEG